MTAAGRQAIKTLAHNNQICFFSSLVFGPDEVSDFPKKGLSLLKKQTMTAKMAPN